MGHDGMGDLLYVAFLKWHSSLSCSATYATRFFWLGELLIYSVYHCYFSPCEFSHQLLVFQWILIDSKSPLVSGTLFSILAHPNKALVYKLSRFFLWFLTLPVPFPSAPITICNAGVLGKVEHPCFAIAPRTTLARSSSTWVK